MNLALHFGIPSLQKNCMTHTTKCDCAYHGLIWGERLRVFAMGTLRLHTWKLDRKQEFVEL